MLSENQGKLTEVVDEVPKDKRERMLARKNSMTAADSMGDDPCEASGSKEGPGRLSTGCHFSTFSPSRRHSSGASSSSSSHDIGISSLAPSFAAQGNDKQDFLEV